MLPDWFRWRVAPPMLAVLFCALVPSAASAAGDLWVSPAGNDSAPGTQQAPLRTVDKALGLATAGQTIKLRAGNYPAVNDSRVHPQPVTVEPADANPPTVAGLNLYGAQHVTFERLRITGTVYIYPHKLYGAAKQPATDVTLRDNEVTTNYAGYCVLLRAGHHISILHNHLHDCVSGIASPPKIAPSVDVQVRDNVLEDFHVDAIQLSEWHDSTIENNVMRRIEDPAHKAHNDGLQMVGGNDGVQIIGNRISESHHQLMLIQDQASANRNLLFENNIMWDCGAYGVQVFGTQNTRFVNNTIWGCRWSALLVRNGHYGPPDVTVVNNVLSGVETIDARIAVRHNNVVGSRTAASGDQVGADPRFVDSTDGDFRLQPGSPALGAADASLAPTLDQLGNRRPAAPASGALESVVADAAPPIVVPGTDPLPTAPSQTPLPTVPVAPAVTPAPQATPVVVSPAPPVTPAKARLHASAERIARNGGKLEYRVVISNAGTATARRVVAVAKLSKRYTRVSGGTRDGRNAKFWAPTLAAGRTVTFKLVVKVTGHRGTTAVPVTVATR